MNISNIKVIITEKDLNSIVSDVLTNYVHIDGLTIDKILIDENINVVGSYKYKVSIPFSIDISIKKVESNILYLSLDAINVKSFKVFKGVINTVLKLVGSKVKEFGIIFENNLISIRFEELCKVIPMVNFSLKELKPIPYGLEAEVGDFYFNSEKLNSVSPSNETESGESADKDENLKDGQELDYNLNISGNNEERKETNKVVSKEYTYRKFRKELQDKFSDKNKKFYPYIVLIPDITALLFRLYKDERVAKEIKTNISIALGYLMFPLDIIPDIVPFLGKIDDLAVVFYILQKILCDIPEEVILDNWEGEANIIEVSREAMSLFNDKFGSKEIRKIVDYVRIAMKKTTNFFVK